MAEAPQRPEGIEGLELAGPFPVGAYAAKLRDELRKRARVQLFGEVWNFRTSRAKVYFELRDGDGAIPCAMWRDAFERAALPDGAFVDGAQVVVAGGPDYYPGSRTSSPAFSFAVPDAHTAGGGDRLARREARRRQLAAEGLFEPQKALALPALPRCIGVVTGEGGKARDDVLAGLHRRGWAGRLVWAFAPVQDRHAAGAITRALQDLAAIEEVDVVIVARGGGSLADLFAFCDETLCRTVALLRVPVLASVGHHPDRMLIDDVAAVRCSTPTHAAEAAVPCHPLEARQSLARAGARLDMLGRRATLERARTLAQLSRAPARHVARHRTRLHQLLRELRAVSRRAVVQSSRVNATHAAALARKARAAEARVERAAVPAPALERAATAAVERRPRELDRLLATLDAHAPQRTLERGYALIGDAGGEPVTTAA